MKPFHALLALGVAAAFCPAPAQAADKPAAKSTKVAKLGKPAASLPEADQTQIDAAERTYFGIYQCEFNQVIDVGLNPKSAGYVDVKYQKKVFTMKPVLSSTGALRLEDVKGQTLLLQIANKSMLMDVKAGRRLVDDCVHEKQRDAAAALAAGQK